MNPSQVIDALASVCDPAELQAHDILCALYAQQATPDAGQLLAIAPDLTLAMRQIEEFQKISEALCNNIISLQPTPTTKTPPGF